MNLVCIRCPLGCHLTVEEKNGEVIVSGNNCKRGEEYAISELKNPMRTLTTTIDIDSLEHRRLPVISSNVLPKDKIMDVVKELKNYKVKAPIKINDEIDKNILNLGVDIIASRTIEK